MTADEWFRREFEAEYAFHLELLMLESPQMLYERTAPECAFDIVARP